jgi:hypothetical protein
MGIPRVVRERWIAWERLPAVGVVGLDRLAGAKAALTHAGGLKTLSVSQCGDRVAAGRIEMQHGLMAGAGNATTVGTATVPFLTRLGLDHLGGRAL